MTINVPFKDILGCHAAYCRQMVKETKKYNTGEPKLPSVVEFYREIWPLVVGKVKADNPAR